MGSGPSVEEVCEAKALGRMISDYVRSLNKRQRYLFFDRYYMAESEEKIASDLSIPVKTAYWEIGQLEYCGDFCNGSRCGGGGFLPSPLLSIM